MITRKVLVAWLIILALAGCAGGSLSPSKLTAAPTATITATLTPCPTLTPTATVTPTPTPLPAASLADARQAYVIGDWDAAAYAYRALLSAPGTAPDDRVEASLGLGQTYLADGAASEAIPVLEALLTTTDPMAPSQAAAAHVLLGDVLLAVGSPISATEHYSAVLALEPLLASYAYDWMGDALYAGGAYEDAARIYGEALPDAEAPSQRVWLLERIAVSRSAYGDYAGALAAYDEILSIAQIPDYRARILSQAADTAWAYGDLDEAYARMAELVTGYPNADQAYTALVKLVEGDQPVDERLRGLIDYRAKAYGPAVQAFYRLIQGDPNHDGEPHYYAALSYLKAGSPEMAIDEFDVLIETHPDDGYVPDAWMGKAQALLALGRPDDALEAYRAGLDLYPGGEAVPSAIWDVVDDLMDAGGLEQTAELLLDLAVRYPDDALAPDARFRAGLAYYRAGDMEAARVVWRDLTLWYPYAERTQAAWYWLGKTYLATGETISATEALSNAVGLGAWSFYGLQAGDALAGRQPFTAYPDSLALCEDGTAQAEAEAWLANWLGLDPALSVGTLSETLANDPRLQRGTRLLALGHFDEARTELEALRTATAQDPLAQYQLALTFRDIGLYRSSILAAATVWRLSPAKDVTDVPPFIGCLTYPRYYSDLLEQEAARYDLSPLFAYALLRQESLFEGFATSYAAAHGLMQVIPATGAAIADALGWPPDYTTADLYRPMVSVRFGTWYLTEQRELFDGNLFPAMAAYNGGPGNALRWMEEAVGDTDLFVELIDFPETSRYVRYIREHYAYYRHLYSAPIELMTPATILRESD